MRDLLLVSIDCHPCRRKGDHIQAEKGGGNPLYKTNPRLKSMLPEYLFTLNICSSNAIRALCIAVYKSFL
jgi:hypothetical protein